MAGTKKVAAVGLRDLAIAARLTAVGTPTWIDVPGATDASFKLAVSEVEQWGDDVLLGTFYHSQKGSISAKASYLAMEILEALSGNTVRSSGGAEIIDIGTAAELTPPRVSVKAQVANARHDDGTTAVITAYFYNCSVKTVFESIPEAALGKLLEVTLNFNVYNSSTDEKGQTLSQAAFGRLEVN
jgi:hypothetical protein